MKKKVIFISVFCGLAVILILGLYLYYNSDVYKLKKIGFKDDVINVIIKKGMFEEALGCKNSKLFSLFVLNDDFIYDNLSTYEKLADLNDKINIVDFVNRIKKEENYIDDYIIDYASNYSGDVKDIPNLVNKENGIKEKTKLENYLLKIGYIKNEETYSREHSTFNYKKTVEGFITIEKTVFLYSNDVRIFEINDYDDGGYYNSMYFSNEDKVTLVHGSEKYPKYSIMYSKSYDTLDTSCSTSTTVLNCDADPGIASSFRNSWLQVFEANNIDIELWFK